LGFWRLNPRVQLPDLPGLLAKHVSLASHLQASISSSCNLCLQPHTLMLERFFSIVRPTTRASRHHAGPACLQQHHALCPAEFNSRVMQVTTWMVRGVLGRGVADDDERGRHHCLFRVVLGLQDSSRAMHAHKGPYTVFRRRDSAQYHNTSSNQWDRHGTLRYGR
jgi:hypothetical protein